jgi:hypothetical protein
MDSLRNQSFEELISIKKERDDLVNRVRHLEKEQFNLKNKMRATQSEVSINRELKGDRALLEEELAVEIKKLKSQIQQLRVQVNATEAGERRLKLQLISQESEFDEERREMRMKITKEKKTILKIQEANSKNKEEFTKYKNTILREMIYKDEIIHNLSLQVNELKAHLRKNETKEFENKLKELEKTSADKILLEYDSSEILVNSSRAYGGSRTPFTNKTTNEIVMYGGGSSAIDSMIGSFPQDKSAVLTSQDFLTQRRSKNTSQDFDFREQDSNREANSRLSIKHSIAKHNHLGRSTEYNQDGSQANRNLKLSKFCCKGFIHFSFRIYFY